MNICITNLELSNNYTLFLVLKILHKSISTQEKYNNNNNKIKILFLL